jgi:hypothetical protein
VADARTNHHSSSTFLRNRLPGPRFDDEEQSALQGKVLTTRIGLHIPTAIPFDEWKLAGLRLSGIVDSSCWWLGDWLIYGKERYADRYQRGIEAVGLRYQTLRNYAWVAGQFPLHRRRAALTFQHHSELASLPEKEQDEWLDRAERRNWTTKQLRSAVRFAHRKDIAREDDGQAGNRKQLTLPGSRVEWWNKAAQRSGVEFDQWVLATLDHAAQTILDDSESTTSLSATSTHLSPRITEPFSCAQQNGR